MTFGDLKPGDLFIEGAYDRGWMCISSVPGRVVLMLCWGEGKKFSYVVQVLARLSTMYNSQVWRDGQQILRQGE